MSDAKAPQIPEGIEPFSVSMGNMEKLGLKNGPEITDIVDYKIFEKKEVVADMEKSGFLSAFHALRKKIEAYKGDDILIVADLDCTYKDMCNFYWCSTEASYKEHMDKFTATESESKKKEAEESKEQLIKYLSIIRISSDKKIDTIAHFNTDSYAYKEEHKAVCEGIVKDHSSEIFGSKPFRKTEKDEIDYMAHGLAMDEEYEMDSQLVVAAGFGKLFSNLAEPELSLTIEKAFKYQAGIEPAAVEAAIYNEFNEVCKEHFQRIADQFEDEADDPNEVIPEYEDKPLIAKREWKPLTMEDVEQFDKETNPEDRPKRRPKWVFETPSVEDSHVANTRPLYAFTMSKPRREFAYDCTFEDYEEETATFFPRQETEDYKFERKDLDIGFQCINPTTDIACQTQWSRKVNKIVQVLPRTLTPSQLAKIYESNEIMAFIASKVPTCKHFLESNDVVDLFNDEFRCLEEIESTVGKNTETNLKSMSPLKVPGMPPRRICDICWHPSVKGMVAYACGSNLDVEKSVDLSGKVMWTSIIMWNLNTLLSPRLRLAVPGDVQCFAINSDNPYIVVAGLETGQVIMWDLSSSTIGGEDVYVKNLSSKSAGDDATNVPAFSHKVISVLQVSHVRAVSSLQWLPKGIGISRKGKITYDPCAKHPNFFATTSCDGIVYFWDINLKESHHADGSIDKNLRWGPTFKTTLLPGGAKFNLAATSFALLSSSSSDVKTRLGVVTEAGEVAFGNWALEGKAAEKEGATLDPITTVRKAHNTFCVDILQSPHFPDICMTVGDWTFSIWKEGCNEPIFTSCCAAAYITSACWSPTRPGLIILGRSDGVLDIWILIDQVHKPVMHKTVRANTEICSLRFWNGRAQQLLAAGDFSGTLHVFGVPRILMRPAQNEKRAMRDWYDHELERLRYVQNRTNNSRPEAKSEEKKKAKAQAKSGPSSDELMAEKEKEYQQMLAAFREKFFPPQDDA